MNARNGRTGWVVALAAAALGGVLLPGAGRSEEPRPAGGTPAPGAVVPAGAGVPTEGEVPDVPPGVEDPLRRTALVRAVERVSPAVVNIATNQVVPVDGFANLLDELRGRVSRFGYRRTQSLGSGVVIDPEGYILTNSHVVRAATEIHVKFGGVQDPADEGALATVVADDPRNDLALVKIEGGPYPFVEMGSSHDLLIGEPAIAIGNPYGLTSSVAMGVISATERVVDFPTGTIPGVIQIDAAIDPGNSGGPLLNVRGRLIGLNTAILQQARAIGFAIPVDRVKRLLARLVDPVRGATNWVGFDVSNRGADLIVDDVEGGGPAQRGGLRVGDAVLAVDGSVPRSVLHLKRLLFARERGEEIRLRVRRAGAGAPVDVSVTVQEDPVFRAARERIGVVLEPFAVQPERPEARSPVKFRVRNVVAGGSAARVEVRPDDVLDSLANVPLDTVETLEEAMRVLPSNRPVPLRLLRQHEQRWRYMSADLILAAPSK